MLFIAHQLGHKVTTSGAVAVAFFYKRRHITLIKLAQGMLLQWI